MQREVTQGDLAQIARLAEVALENGGFQGVTLNDDPDIGDPEIYCVMNGHDVCITIHPLFPERG